MERKSVSHTIETPEQAVQFLLNRPFSHQDLELVAVPGSRSNGTFGKLSDLDIVSVTKSDDPKTVDIEPILSLGVQLNIACQEIHNAGFITPVIIATMRLEEAQIELAQLINPGKTILPVHWLHYPSIAFMATNEPPALALGLLSGAVLIGEPSSMLARLEHFIEHPVEEISGLDWLTDSLRILIANQPIEGAQCRFPLEFLKKHALHNLHYFWKWNIIAPLIRRKTNTIITDWKQIEQIAYDLIPEMMVMFDRIHQVRHTGKESDSNEIIELHRLTFRLLPVTNSL